MLEKRRYEFVALGSESQYVSVDHKLGYLGNPIDRVCLSLLSVCLGHRKDLALITAVAASAADACCPMLWLLPFTITSRLPSAQPSS